MARLSLRYAALALLLTASPSASFARSACDREYLGTMLDRYLSAVVANDPGAAGVVPQ